MKFTIAMPNYNYGQFVGEGIESVLRQDYDDWELFVWDNCSTDNSVEVAQKYADMDSRVHVKVAERNSGGPIEGINNVFYQYATGDIFLWLCSDDMMGKNYFTEVLPYFKDPEIGFVRIGCLIVPGPGNTTRKEEAYMRPIFWPRKEEILRENKVYISSPFRKKLFFDVGGITHYEYVEGEPYDQLKAPYFDWDFWIKCTFSGAKWATNMKPLLIYREHGSNASRTDDLDGMVRTLMARYQGKIDTFKAHDKGGLA